MNQDMLDKQMSEYIANNEIAGAALLVRQDNHIIYQKKWGYANIEEQLPVEYDTIYRLASLTKPIVAVAIMILSEQGKLHLDDNMDSYIPEFNPLMVCKPEFHTDSLGSINELDLDSVDRVPARRNVTIRDLLSHSSGLGMGAAGLRLASKLSDPSDTLASRFRKFNNYPADFEPGEYTGYSPIIGFDALGRIIEVASGMELDLFLQAYLFDPLEMSDTTFRLNENQTKRLAVLYKSDSGMQFRASYNEDLDGLIVNGSRYCSGAAGLYSTLNDYDHFAQMLMHEGKYGSTTVLQAESVRRMHQQGAYKYLELAPGLIWGLGMMIRQEPRKAKSFLSKGSYGWSGAYGTHMFVDPIRKVSAVLMLNRSNIGGAGSYVSKKVEELIYTSLVEGSTC